MRSSALVFIALYSTLSFGQTSFSFKSEDVKNGNTNKIIRIEKSYSIAVPVRIGNSVETSYYGVDFAYDMTEFGSIDDGGDSLYGSIKLICKDIPVIVDSAFPKRYQDIPVTGMDREACIKMHLKMKEFKVRRIQGPITSTDIDRQAFCTTITIEQKKGKSGSAEVTSFYMVEDLDRVTEYHGQYRPHSSGACAK